MNDIFLLAIVGVIGIGIGFILGLLVNVFRPGEQNVATLQTADDQLAQVTVAPLEQAPAQSGQDQPSGAASITSQQIEPVVTDALPVSSDAKPRPPSFNPMDIFSRAIQADVKAPAPKPLSIAAQVDEILQEMLVASPLSERSIRLVETPEGGLMVTVGLDRYDGIDGVPDDEIRSLIRKAVAEWERRTEH